MGRFALHNRKNSSYIFKNAFFSASNRKISAYFTLTYDATIDQTSYLKEKTFKLRFLLMTSLPIRIVPSYVMQRTIPLQWIIQVLTRLNSPLIGYSLFFGSKQLEL
jgi:hypothetical protein